MAEKHGSTRVELIGERTKNPYDPGWSRKVRVSGVDYWVGVRGSKRVRIPYKPRGQNIGWTWIGWVREAGTGRELLWGRCNGNLGARGLLKRAGVLEEAA